MYGGTTAYARKIYNGTRRVPLGKRTGSRIGEVTENAPKFTGNSLGNSCESTRGNIQARERTELYITKYY